MKIDYYIKDENEDSKVEMIYCKRLQSAVRNNNYFLLNQNYLIILLLLITITNFLLFRK